MKPTIIILPRQIQTTVDTHSHALLYLAEVRLEGRREGTMEAEEARMILIEANLDIRSEKRR